MEQVKKAMAILQKHYPDEDHVFVYDNASTHMKRADGALSASKMTKGPSACFHAEINVLGDDGRPVYNAQGKYVKAKIKMSNARFADGTEQKLYFADDHPKHAGMFKGIKIILDERGISTHQKKLQCKQSFADCPEGATDCCCCRILYNQPDFVEVESVLETTCKSSGFQVLFLPKFHCELNFIEQCWGTAKRYYCLLPPSSKEDVLSSNVLASLDQIEIIQMRR